MILIFLRVFAFYGFSFVIRSGIAGTERVRRDTERDSFVLTAEAGLRALSPTAVYSLLAVILRVAAPMAAEERDVVVFGCFLGYEVCLVGLCGGYTVCLVAFWVCKGGCRDRPW